MRLRRSVLATLAPLLGVSALVAIIAAGPESLKPAKAQQNPLVRLIHSVFQLVAPAPEAPPSDARAQHPSPRAFLSSAALAYTPLGHSLWMITAPLVPLAAARAQQRPLLRC
jgi:hypothetical protein